MKLMNQFTAIIAATIVASVWFAIRDHEIARNPGFVFGTVIFLAICLLSVIVPYIIILKYQIRLKWSQRRLERLTLIQEGLDQEAKEGRKYGERLYRLFFRAGRFGISDYIKELIKTGRIQDAECIVTQLENNKSLLLEANDLGIIQEVGNALLEQGKDAAQQILKKAKHRRNLAEQANSLGVTENVQLLLASGREAKVVELIKSAQEKQQRERQLTALASEVQNVRPELRKPFEDLLEKVRSVASAKSREFRKTVYELEIALAEYRKKAAAK